MSICLTACLFLSLPPITTTKRSTTSHDSPIIYCFLCLSLSRCICLSPRLSTIRGVAANILRHHAEQPNTPSGQRRRLTTKSTIPQRPAARPPPPDDKFHSHTTSDQSSDQFPWTTKEFLSCSSSSKVAPKFISSPSDRLSIYRPTSQEPSRLDT